MRKRELDHLIEQDKMITRHEEEIKNMAIC